MKLTKLLFFFAAMFVGTVATAQVVINEYSAANLNSHLDNYNEYEDWIELYNTGTTAADISGYSLSDKIDKPFKWSFPEGTILNAGGFLRVWASGRNATSSAANLHTNFKLSQTKDDPEYVMFNNLFGSSIDQIVIERTQKEHSRGRTTNGGEEWSIFTNTTPGYSNNGATAYQRYAVKPQMSEMAGFYNNSIYVEITSEEPDATIYFTEDI